MSDLYAAARQLNRRFGLSATIIGILAVGIGVNVAIFSLFQQILLRPLQVPEPQALVNLTDPGADLPGPQTSSISGGPDSIFSYPMFRDLEREQESFVGIAAHRVVDVSLSAGGQARLDSGILVSGSYFSVLGLQPALGRLLGPQDDGVAGQAESVVLSHAYWQSELGGDPGVLGRTLTLNGIPLTIVGVAPRGFHGTTVGIRASVFLPIAFRWLDVRYSDSPDDRLYRWIHLFARLAPGVGREEAAAAINPPYRAILNEMDAPLAAGVDERMLEQFRGKSLVLEPGAQGQSVRLAPVRNRLAMLFSLSGVVLLLCCANVAGLMLVRGAARTGEMAVRASLGATRGRLASLLLIESLALALPAAVVSLPIAWLTLRGMAAGLGELAGIPAAAYDVNLDAGAVVVAVGVTVVSALVFGLFPAWSLTRTEPAKALQAYSARQTSGKAVARFGTALATAQIALSMALLATAGVFAQSLVQISRIELGFDADPVTMFSVAPGTSGYSAQAAAALHGRLEEELAAIPGVTSVASSEFPWLSGFLRFGGVFPDGADQPSFVSLSYVSSRFFDAVGMTLLAGRGFGDADVAGAPEVAIVNQRFAERFGLGPGERVALRAGRSAEIVGLAADAKYADVTGETQPLVFLPTLQGAEFATATFYVRSARPPEDLLNAIREAVARVDPILPITGLRPMRQQVRESSATERFVAAASTAFAVLATILAGLGLYGVLAYSVAQRSREIGLRVALGAPARRIRRMVLQRMVTMMLVGGAIGAVAAVLLGRAAQSLLFGVEAGEPVALAAAAGFLVAVTLGSAYLPVRRAVRIDPMTALRYE